MMVINFQRRFCMVLAYELTAGLDDRGLALIAADGRLGYFDPDFIGDLQLDALVAQPGDLPVDAPGGDHPVAYLQSVQELLHLLLLPLHGQQDDEIEDTQNEDERHQLEPRTASVGRSGHGQQQSNHSHDARCGALLPRTIVESAGQALTERDPETFKPPKRYSVPNPSERV